MYVNDFTNCKTDLRVASKVKHTCFSHFFQIRGDYQIKKSLCVITALVSFYRENYIALSLRRLWKMELQTISMLILGQASTSLHLSDPKVLVGFTYALMVRLLSSNNS